MDQLPQLEKRELICLLLFTCNYVVSVWRGFLFLCVLGMGHVISSPEPSGSQGELIGYPSSRRPSVVFVNNFKHLLLRNRWADQSQILCGASLGRGNDIFFASSGSHYQDGPHAHIW